MNVPITASIDLAPLANVELPQTTRKLRTFASLGSAGALAAASFLAWRIAPRVASRRHPSRALWWTIGAASVASVAIARWQLQRLFAAEPDYAIESNRGPLEIRRYAPMRIARTSVAGEWTYALNEGFDRLANFIFGGNGDNKRIAMTAPVLGARESNGGYRVAFITPKGVEPPTPDDSRVTLDSVPERRIAVLRFNGRHDARTIETKKRELIAAATTAGLTPRGEASFAGYDPPTTLPILRRNEVWLEVDG